MIGLQIAIECGVSVLPMIVYHVGQLLIDTVVADRWKQKHSDP
jgi:sodium/bile acid cotransporter 7